MKSSIRVKIGAVSGILTNASTKSTNYRQVLTVIEVPEDNPFGMNYDSKAVPFEIEIHNDNIKKFSLQPHHVNEEADVELVIRPFKKDANTPVAFTFLVNKLRFVN